MVLDSRAVAAAAALTLLTPAAPAAAAVPRDFDIVAGDQATGSLLGFASTDQNWNASPRWQWRPAAPDFTADDISAYRLVSDMKLRVTPSGAERFVTTASYGLMALLDDQGRRIWSARVPSADNPHAIELLPDGNVAVAASNGGWVRVYPAGGGTPAEFPLTNAHAALWDPVQARLWTIGDRPTGRSKPDGTPVLAPTLIALEVYGPPSRPGLREDVSRGQMFDAGTMTSDYGHDVYADSSTPNILWITSNRAVFRYDTTTGQYTERTPSMVKSIGVLPSGVLVRTRPDSVQTPPGPCSASTWCTSGVDLIGPDGTTTTRTRTGAAFYKARVWTPYSTVVDRPLRGPVLDSVRSPGGQWSTTRIDRNDAISGVAGTAAPDGAVHVFTLVPGSGVWERVRTAAGTWPDSAPVTGTADVSHVATATDAAGRVHLFTVVPGAGVDERIDGGPARRIDTNGSITRVAAALGGDGRLRLFTLVRDRGVWGRTASDTGWTSYGWVDENPKVTSMSAATDSSGRTHLFTVVPGRGVWERVSDGATWPGSTQILTTDTADVTALAATRAGDQLWLSVARSGLGVQTYRAGWTLDHTDPTRANVLDVYATGEPGGALHVGTLPEVS